MSINNDSYFKSVNDDITDLAKQNISLTLWQSYKGLMFRQDVKILGVYPRYSIFETLASDHFPEVGKMVHLQSAQLARPLSTNVVGKNPLRSRLILSNLRYSTHVWINRSMLRVQPSRPIYAVMSCGWQEITARLIDIQANGMAVVANTNALEQAAVRLGAIIHASFPLTPELSLKQVAGSIQNISTFTKSLSRIGISIHARPGLTLTLILQNYINRRQEEIMHELGPIFDRSLESPFGAISEFSSKQKSQDFQIATELEIVS